MEVVPVAGTEAETVETAVLPRMLAAAVAAVPHMLPQVRLAISRIPIACLQAKHPVLQPRADLFLLPLAVAAALIIAVLQVLAAVQVVVMEQMHKVTIHIQVEAPFQQVRMVELVRQVLILVIQKAVLAVMAADSQLSRVCLVKNRPMLAVVAPAGAIQPTEKAIPQQRAALRLAAMAKSSLPGTARHTHNDG